MRKIVRAAHWLMDRLHAVEAVTSSRGLIVSFKVKKMDWSNKGMRFLYNHPEGLMFNMLCSLRVIYVMSFV